MRKLRIGIIDLVSKGPTRALFPRIANANYASIMPQVVAVWCAEAGHDVVAVCYTGFEDLVEELPENVDLVFISTFTEAAHTAYALSALFRSRGAVTAIGGPHARCYPEDAERYFDYVLGFTDKSVIGDVLRDCSPNRPGIRLSASQQPRSLPGVRERWPFIEATLRKSPFIKVVPMLGSLGCPYTCSFCIDSTVPYQMLDLGVMKEDLAFLLTKFKRPVVGWHDPNFGVRFDAYLDAIEAAVPPGRMDFIAESSLSLLTEPHLKRLQRNSFQAMLPGIESWYGMGEKSRTGSATGIEKVRRVADQVNMILSYVPYMQTNFVFGLDSDEGSEPFELTKRFVDLAPGAYPTINLLNAYGQAAPINLEYQRANRVLPLPFHFSSHATNVKPKNYSWRTFYDRVIDLSKYALSWKAIGRRLRANRGLRPQVVNFVRAVSASGRGWTRDNETLRLHLDTDASLRRFFDGESTALPEFYAQQVKRDLGPLWDWLPAGALTHDPNGWLKETAKAAIAATPIEAADLDLSIAASHSA
jgi:hypothetical protein